MTVIKRIRKAKKQRFVSGKKSIFSESWSRKYIKGSEELFNGEKIYIVKGSAGSFLEPPGHPTHKYAIESSYRTQSITSFYNEVKDPKIRKQLKPYLKWEKLPENDPRVKRWEQKVYRYFQHSKSPTGKMWKNVDELVTDKNVYKTPEKSAAVIWIRKYYPNHKPNIKWLKNPPPPNREE